MITPFKNKIVEVLERNLSNSKEAIADEIIEIILSETHIQSALPHIHEAGKENIDECGICGHDIRHEIHCS